jgi:membrane associated rhomboid family serine protease
MFFPLRDHNPTRGPAWVTYTLILVNIIAFVFVRGREARGEYWWNAWYGLVPGRFLGDPSGEVVTVFSSMFMHGSWLHLGSNMWFLRLFGDNLEDALGRVRYLAFYVICGIGAAAAQVGFDAASAIPMVGASGAIAGVVGGYMVLYPRAPISSFNMVPLLWLFLGIVTVVPAWLVALLFLGQNLWMALESVAGLGSAGVAFAAHLGGFMAGLALIKVFHTRPPTTREVWRAPTRRRLSDGW